ncbi:MAG: HAMP domain-containing protein, partial [Thermoleophilia bacterium]|nr:HAMP domain-containing protein [Thermoleophilia bacterium]
LGGLVGTVLLVFLFAAYLVRSAIEPVEDVARAARRLREGDRTARAKERAGTDEASELTRDFNTMAATLARTLEDVGRQRSELEAVLDSAGEGITMTDPDGELVFSNERMETLWLELGMHSGGSIWERVARLAQLTPDPESYGPAFAAIAADPEAVLEDDFDVPSLQRSFHGYTAPVRGPYGFVIGRVFSLRETTTERAAEQAKEQFLATVSHELRTPLTSIRGYLELVRDGEAGELTREQDRFLEIVDRSARNLHTLVDDLLTLGRSATAGLELELDEVELDELVSECVESAGTEAAEKRIAVRLDAEPGLRVRGDRRRLGQLATNLVGNAIKFTPMGGSVDVSAHRDGGVASLEVSDTGIGIPAAEQERLFERFFRASSAAAAQVPGTGLGLAISKEIAEAHGGTITVRSAEGAGTTFRVELPVGGPQ